MSQAQPATLITNDNIRQFINLYVNDKPSLPEYLRGIPIGEWNVSNVTDMNHAFYNLPFNEPLTNWDVSHVTNMESMFERCGNFNQPLNHLIVNNVTNMKNIFKLCRSFNEPLNEWDIRNVTNMNSMFELCTSFNQPLTNWYLNEDVTTHDMFRDCNISQGNIPYFVMQYQYDDSGLPPEDDEDDEDHEDEDDEDEDDEDEDSEEEDSEDYEITNDNINELVRNYVFNKPLLPRDLRYTPIGEWDVSNVTFMHETFMNLDTFNESVNDWDVSHVTSMVAVFIGCTSFNQPLNKWIVSNVLNMEAMFKDCTNFNQSLNDWDVRNVLKMENMFDGCTNFDHPLFGWDVNDNVETSDMFRDCNISQVNIPEFAFQIQYDDAGLEFAEDEEDEENAYVDDADAPGPEENDDLEDIEMEEGGPLSCRAEIQMFDVDYKKYLAKNPKNFIMFNTANGDKTCSSVNDLARLANTNDDNIPDVYFECTDRIMRPQFEIVAPRTQLATTPLGFGPDDYIQNPTYIKIDSLNSFIVKPDWLYNGIPPEPRIFKKVPKEPREEKFLVSRYIATNPEANAISGIHCDKLDKFQIFDLVPLTQAEIATFDTSVTAGGKKKRKTKKILKKKKNIIKKNKKYTIKKSKKYTIKKRKNNKKNIRKTKNKKGGKKKKQKKKTLKKKYIRK